MGDFLFINFQNLFPRTKNPEFTPQCDQCHIGSNSILDAMSTTVILILL